MSSLSICDFFCVREPRMEEKKLLSPESPAAREAVSAALR
jgi:hypothetical protein